MPRTRLATSSPHQANVDGEEQGTRDEPEEQTAAGQDGCGEQQNATNETDDKQPHQANVDGEEQGAKDEPEEQTAAGQGRLWRAAEYYEPGR